MDIVRAKELLSALADGIDPFTGELLPQNAGKPWTDIEEEKLLDEFDSGMTTSAIAKEHGRSKGAIESRLADLGKITDTYFNRKPR